MGHAPTVDFSLENARDYSAAVRWQFAKTMPQWPHECTLRRWRSDLATEFDAVVRMIRAEGTVEPWPKGSTVPRYHHTYLMLDGKQYWTMGEPLDEMLLINRRRIDSPAAA